MPWGVKKMFLFFRLYPGNTENSLPVIVIDREKGIHAAGVKEKAIPGAQAVEKINAGMNIVVCRQGLEISLIPVSNALIGKGFTAF